MEFQITFNHFQKMTILKALKYKYRLSLGTCHSVVQFTDLTPTIYWCVKRAKLTYNMPVYNPIKSMFVFLNVSQMQCITYRPDLYNSQASRKRLKK